MAEGLFVTENGLILMHLLHSLGEMIACVLLTDGLGVGNVVRKSLI